MRNVIVHYHLFKNAGTSVDRLLKANFADRWCEYEGSGKAMLMPDELGGYLADNPHLLAVSSHNALLPVPELPDVRVFPILFVRHPIDRIRSVYEFERRQNADTEGAMSAKELSFAEYLEWRRGRKYDYTTRNFQAWRLAQGTRQLFGLAHRNIWGRAQKTIETMPLIGLVENFALSIRCQERMLRPHFPDLRLREVRANVSQPSGSDLASRLACVRADLGDEGFRQLVLENELDMRVHEMAHARLVELASGKNAGPRPATD